MACLLGDDFKLYHDTAGNWSTPTWVAQPDVGDLAFDRAPRSAEIPKRGTPNVKYKRGRFDRRVTFTLNYNKGNAFVVAIEAAVEAGSPLHIAVADGVIATAGTIYYHGDYIVVGDPLSANLDEGATFDVELALDADSVNEPAKATAV